MLIVAPEALNEAMTSSNTSAKNDRPAEATESEDEPPADDVGAMHIEKTIPIPKYENISSTNPKVEGWLGLHFAMFLINKNSIHEYCF